MTVLVGYVPKPEGIAAVNAALEQARWRGEDVYVVNGSRGEALVDRSFASPEDLDVVRRTLEDSGVPFHLEQHVAGKGGADDVLELADRLRPSIIVIGIRHRTPTGKMITGSDAQRILLNADCPVLSVKAASGQA